MVKYVKASTAKYTVSDIEDFCDDLASSMEATFVNFDALWKYAKSIIGNKKTFTSKEYDSICYDIEYYANTFDVDEFED